MDIEFIKLSAGLDRCGLLWLPEIGDEVVQRPDLQKVSILVDPQGLTPKELRHMFLWLPTVEQLVEQFEARQAMIYHAGLNNLFGYEAVIKRGDELIETAAATLRLAFGRALYELLAKTASGAVH